VTPELMPELKEERYIRFRLFLERWGPRVKRGAIRTALALLLILKFALFATQALFIVTWWAWKVIVFTLLFPLTLLGMRQTYHVRMDIR
jgi:hypothetical protein